MGIDDQPVNLEDLKRLSRPELDRVFAAWRTTRPDDASTDVGTGTLEAELADGVDPQLAQMVRLGTILPGWGRVAARLARARSVTDVTAASAGGPAGLVRLGELLASGSIDMADADSLAGKLNVPADDGLVLCLWGFSHREFSASGAGFRLGQLVAGTTADDPSGALIYRALMIFANDDPARALSLARAGSARLQNSADDALQADLLNESAVCLAALGRMDESIEMAERARALAESTGLAKLAAMARGNMGYALMRSERLEEAREVFEALEQEQMALGDEDGAKATRFNLATVRQALGEDMAASFAGDSEDPDEVFARASSVAGKGDHFAAIKLFERGFRAIEGQPGRPGREADMRSLFARVLFDAQRHERAVEELIRARDLYEVLGNTSAVLDADLRLGSMLLGEPDRARPYAQRAVVAAEELGDAKSKLHAVVLQAQIESAAGQPDAAVVAYERAAEMGFDVGTELAQALVAAGRASEALDILEKRLPMIRARGDKREELRTLVGLAEAQQSLGRPDEALGTLEQAYAIATSDAARDEWALEASSRYGFALVQAGRLADGAALLEAARAAARVAGPASREHAIGNNLVVALNELGEQDAAVRLADELIEEMRPLGDTRTLARALFGRANAHASRREYAAALDDYAEAERIGELIGDDVVSGGALDSIGTILAEQGEPGRAVEYQRKAVEKHRAAGAWLDMQTDLINLAGSLVAVGDGTGAEAAINEAADVDTRLDQPPSWGLLFQHANVAALQGRWPEARAGFRTAIERLESERGSFPTPAQLRRARRRYGHVFGIASTAAIDAGDAEAAVEFLEGRRTRFLEEVIDRRAARPEGVDEDAWLTYLRAADEVADLRARRRAGGPGDQETAARLHDADRRLEAAADVVAEGARDRGASTKPLVAADLAQILEPSTAAVSIEADRSGLEVVCTARDGDAPAQFRSVRDPGFDSDDLGQLVYRGNGTLPWAILWAGDLATRKQRRDIIGQTCASLGARIWPAILDLLPPSVDRLVLLPSAGLNVMPLHAAILPDGSSACDRFRISYAPSLGLLARASDHPAGATSGVLGQAVPPSGDLPFAAIEGAEVSEHHEGKIDRLEGPAATASEVLALLSRSDAVHFAGHGRFDAEDVLGSYLACAADGGDGRLTAGQILWAPRSLRARLVALAACESGRVDEADLLDDFIGLPGTLLATGARHVLAAFWEVDDLVTAIFVDRFFADWSGGAVSPPEALSSAQRSLRSEVRVADVQERLTRWRDQSADPRVARVADAWLARTDKRALAFPDEIDWAPFHIVGLP
jgi:CHAT domain-containing protein/tetratricopeptide (TPR) repeat protein